MSEKNGLPSLLDRHWAESALAIGAVIIAAVSLWVAVDAERTNRELVAAASWPFVGFYSTEPVNAQPRILTLVLTNQGIGPARLESFELFWNGRAQRSPWMLLQSCCVRSEPGSGPVLTPDPAIDTASDEGIVVRAGESVTFLAYTRTAGDAAVWDALASQYVASLSVRYCYCSVFNECWLVSARLGVLRNLNPPRVRTCPRPDIHYDNTLG